MKNTRHAVVGHCLESRGQPPRRLQPKAPTKTEVEEKIANSDDPVLMLYFTHEVDNAQYVCTGQVFDRRHIAKSPMIALDTTNCCPFKNKIRVPVRRPFSGGRQTNLTCVPTLANSKSSAICSLYRPIQPFEDLRPILRVSLVP